MREQGRVLYQCGVESKALAARLPIAPSMGSLSIHTKCQKSM
jgi:hypothetical protein